MKSDKIKNQHGFTFMTIALILALIAFFSLLTLKIAPIYLDHSKIISVFEDIKKLPDLESKSKYEIQTMIGKRLNMNYITHIGINDIEIQKRPHYLKIALEYERVVPIYGNLSALAEFSDVVETGVE